MPFLRFSRSILLSLFLGPLLLLTQVPGVFAQGGSDAFSVSPQQMLQGVDVQTAQQLSAASNAIQRNPNDVNALLQRGTISLGIADRSPYSFQWVHFAAIDLEKALRLDPNSFVAHHAYGVAYYMAGDASDDQPNMHQAVAQFTRAIQLKPDFARSYMGRGYAYLMMDDEAHADPDFQKALQLDPSLQNQLTTQADAIRQKRGQKGCVKAMMDRMSAYVVDRGATTPTQCAAHKGYWAGSECRISTAMAPGPLALGSQDAATGNRGLASGGCAPPRNAVNNRYDPRIGGSVVK